MDNKKKAERDIALEMGRQQAMRDIYIAPKLKETYDVKIEGDRLILRSKKHKK